MPRRCVVRDCQRKGVVLFSLNSSDAKRNHWAAILGIDSQQIRTGMCVCAGHFDDQCWEKTRQDGSKKLKHNARPSVDLCTDKENVNSSILPVIYGQSPPRKRMVVSHGCNVSTNILQLPQTNTMSAGAAENDSQANHVQYDSSLPVQAAIDETKEIAAVLLSLQEVRDVSGNISEPTPTQPGAEFFATLVPEGVANPPEPDSVQPIVIEEQCGDSGTFSEPVHSQPGFDFVTTHAVGVQSSPERDSAKTTVPEEVAPPVSLQSLTSEELILLIQQKERELQEAKKKDLELRTKTEALYRRYSQMKRKNAVYRKKLKRLADSSVQHLVNLNSRLRKDQLSSLTRKSSKGLKWSTETVKEALVHKMKMGTKAYSDFVKQVPIYPSARSLQRDVQHMDFECGILHHVLQAVKPDIQRMALEHRRCVIGMDECAIEEAEVYDPSSKKMIGKSTFGPHEGLAKKANCLVMGGTTRRYKFTGAYHFTSSLSEEEKVRKIEEHGNPVGEALKSLVIDLVIELEGIGLFVDAIIHDMGPDNMALWRALGIECTSKSRVVNCSIPHPVRPGDKLWFIPDTVHLFKNIATSLSSNTVFRLSDDIVVSEGLRCNEVKLEHLQQLLDFEDNFEPKVAYHLKQENLDNKKKFAKMRVSNPCAIFCRRTEAALRAKAALDNDSSFDATIFFVLLVTTWFSLVSNRGGKLALSKGNPVAYEWALEHIRKTADVFKNMKVGGQWKPIQKGMLVACQALLEIQEFLLSRDLVKYVLLGRYTQDFVENIFSLIRARQAIPNALHFKQNLRVITLAQISLTATNTSYFPDTAEDVTLPTDFIAITKKLAAESSDTKSVNRLLEEAAIDGRRR